MNFQLDARVKVRSVVIRNQNRGRLPKQGQLAQARLLLLLLLSIGLSSCLTEPTVPRQVFYRGILTPEGISYRDTLYQPGPPITGDIKVNWLPTLSDTQLNFRGYEVALFLADSLLSFGIDTITPPPGTNYPAAYDSAIVGKYPPLSYTFITTPARPLYIRQYIVAVWGLQFSNPAKPDTLIRSIDSQAITFLFDPRPIEDPPLVRAVSVNGAGVKLAWTLPPCDTQSNVLGYQINLSRTWLSGDSTKRFTSVPAHQSTVVLGGLPAGNNAGVQEGSYRFSVVTVRTDSLMDTSTANAVVWGGAESLSIATPDSSGFLELSDTDIFIGGINGTYGMTATNSSNANILMSVSGGVVTLSAAPSGTYAGAKFSATIDTASAIDSIYYTDNDGLNHANSTTLSSISLPTSGTSIGIVVYYSILNASGQQTFGRLFIERQPGGTFINGLGGITLRATYQPVSGYIYD